jgi:hypothetical protein
MVCETLKKHGKDMEKTWKGHGKDMDELISVYRFD